MNTKTIVYQRKRPGALKPLREVDGDALALLDRAVALLARRGCPYGDRADCHASPEACEAHWLERLQEPTP